MISVAVQRLAVLSLVLTASLVDASVVVGASVNDCYLYKSSGKRGYVDLDRLLDLYNKTIDLDKALKSKGSEKMTEREKLVKEIKSASEELPRLSSDDRARTQLVVDRRIKELKDFDSKTRQWLKMARDAVFTDIVNEIEEEIASYGQTNGYEYITNANCEKSGRDLTNEILSNLNQKYALETSSSHTERSPKV